AVGLPDAVVNAFYAPQGSAYSVRFSWTPSGGILYGQLLFRMKDWSNYYALSFYPTEVGFSTYANGVWADKVRAYRPIDSTHPATPRLGERVPPNGGSPQEDEV